MGAALDRLLRDATLLAIALGIALGWALFQVAHGVSVLINTLLADYPAAPGIHAFNFEPLTWEVGGRLLTFAELPRGLVEHGVVLAVALFLVRRRNA